MKQIHEGAEVLPLPVANDRYRNGGSDTQVPDVVGDSEADATAALQGAGYKVSPVQRNNAQEKGTVVGQSPRGNALAGETITIYVSTGYVPPPQTSAPPTTEQPPPTGGAPPPNGPGG
jgi:beta-lactam-binding protein with PASTA domain